MSLEKADVIVIRLAEFSESSRVVTVFSREYGKFSALAKGAKRLKGPFDAAIDLLSKCRVVFIRKSSGSLDLLTEARLTSRFQPVKSSLNSLYGGYYVADLLCGLTEDYDPSPEIFDLATETLSQLSSGDADSMSAVVRFEVRLLRLSGLLGSLSECTGCGKTMSELGTYAHWVGQGGLLCSECRHPEYSGKSLSAGSVAVLRRLVLHDMSLADRIRLTKQQTIECHQFAVAIISSILGRRPTTLRYLDFK